MDVELVEVAGTREGSRNALKSKANASFFGAENDTQNDTFLG